MTLLQSHRLKSIKMNGNDYLFVIKRIILFIFVLAVLARSTAICVDCENSLQCDLGSIIAVYPYDGGFAVLSSDEGCYTISLVSSDLEATAVNTGFTASECVYTYNNNTFVFGYAEQDDTSNEYDLLLKVYDCIENCFYRKMVNLESKTVFSSIAFDSEGRLYAAENGYIDVFDSNLMFEKKLEPAADVLSLVPNKDGSIIYCVTDKNVCIIRGGELKEIPVTCLEVYPVNGGFSDESGNIYDNDGTLLYSGFACVHGSVVSGEYYLGVKDGFLTAVCGNEEREIVPVSDNIYFCVNNDLCMTAEQGDDTRLAVYTLEDIEKLFACTDTNTSDIQSDAEIDAPQNDEYSYITGLPQECTCAQFRSLYGSDYVFYTPEGSLKISGILGTGIRAVSRNSGERYIIIVFGDVSGDGKITDKDKTDMTNILFGNNFADNEFLLAADVDHNALFELTDLTALELYLENSYDISQSF